MPETPAQKALTASTIALVVAVGSVAMFLPPLAAATTGSVLRTAVSATVLVLACVLHLVWLGRAARHLRRSVAGWVALSGLLFPVGSATALILLGWPGDDASTAPAPRHG